MVVAELVEREEPAAVDLGRPADESVGPGLEEAGDGAVEAPRGERAVLTGPRAETRPPEKSLGLCGTKRARVDGQRHDELSRSAPGSGHSSAG